MSTRIEKVTSPGGIVAWLIESHETPLITITISFKGGSLQDPADKPGLATLLAYMFNEGAGNLRTPEFSNRRDRIGVVLGASASAEAININFETISEHRNEAFELLALAMQKPRYDDEAIATSKNYYGESYGRSLKNPRGRGWDIFNEMVYGRHRLATPDDVLAAALRTFSADDLKAARKRLYARDNAFVSVVGDIGPADLGAWLDRVFDGLPAKAGLVTEPLPVYTGPRKQLYETSTPQALVIFGALAPRIERNSRESFARTLLDNVLNDSFTGRLFTEVREKRGLVYSVSTGYRLNRLCGSYLGSFGSANETAAAALEATLDVLRRTVADGPTEAELGTLKSAAAGRYLLDIEGRNNLVALMAGLQLNGLPIDFHETYVARMRDVTAAEVGDVARKLIKPDQFSIVVVGKPSPAINLL